MLLLLLFITIITIAIICRGNWKCRKSALSRCIKTQTRGYCTQYSRLCQRSCHAPKGAPLSIAPSIRTHTLRGNTYFIAEHIMHAFYIIFDRPTRLESRALHTLETRSSAQQPRLPYASSSSSTLHWSLLTLGELTADRLKAPICSCACIGIYSSVAYHRHHNVQLRTLCCCPATLQSSASARVFPSISSLSVSAPAFFVLALLLRLADWQMQWGRAEQGSAVVL